MTLRHAVRDWRNDWGVRVGPFLLATVAQGGGAPIVDGCTTGDEPGNWYRGRCVLPPSLWTTPRARRPPRRALVLGVLYPSRAYRWLLAVERRLPARAARALGGTPLRRVQDPKGRSVAAYASDDGGQLAAAVERRLTVDAPFVYTDPGGDYTVTGVTPRGVAPIVRGDVPRDADDEPVDFGLGDPHEGDA